MKLITILKKTTILSINLSLILSIILFFDYTTGYTLTYENNNVGSINSLDEISNIEKNINNKITNGNIPITKKINYYPTVIPINTIKTTKEISENIIKTDKDIKKQYGLIINNKTCYINSSKAKIINKVEALIKNKIGTNQTYSYNPYQIKKDYYITKKYTDEDILKELNIQITTEKIITTTENIKYTTEKNIDYTRTGTQKITIQEGVMGESQNTYKNTYINDTLQTKELIKYKTIKKPINKIISIPYKKSKTEKEIIINLTTSQTKFLNEIIPYALQLYKEKNILPSLTLAQAILESAWGTSSIGNNIYGIKAYNDWKGKKSYVWTGEQNSDGTYEKIKCWFKNYDSFGDSVLDYGDLLSSTLYEKVRTANNYRDAAAAVRMAGYATSLNYVDNIINLIETHHLYEYDKINRRVSLNESPLEQQWNQQLEAIKKKAKDESKKKKEKPTKINKKSKKTSTTITNQKEKLTTKSSTYSNSKPQKINKNQSKTTTNNQK